MYYVYILKGPKQLYIGFTSDLKKRLKEHQTNQSKSTKNRGPWKLIYYEASISKKSSLKREKYLKTAWGRRYLKTRLQNDN